MYIYYPSCNFQKQFPATAKAVRAYMSGREDVKVAGCCHVTGGLPEAEDTILTVCMSCDRVLAELRPEIPRKSLFEFLLDQPDFPWPNLNGEEITLQDCFRGRGRHGLQDAARECLRRMNAKIVEMPRNRDEEEFDGSFRFHEPYPQNMKEAPKYFAEYLPRYVTPLPEEAWPARFREHAAQYATKRVACYCTTCVSGAREGGAEALHLAELAFSGMGDRA